MATKRKGFWKDYSKQVVEMTREKNKKDPMDAFWCLNKAIRAITPGVYNDAQVENLMKIYDVIVAEKEANPSWQLPSPETRKRKKPRLK